MYEERDYFIMQLPEAELTLLYEQYTALYLNPATAAPLRGMAEMVVIRLGELVSMPQPLRMQQAERIRDERRRAGSSELPLSTTTGGVLGSWGRVWALARATMTMSSPSFEVFMVVCASRWSSDACG